MAARGSVAERSKALDLGSSPRGDVGSNPTAASGARRPLLCPPPQNPSLNVPGLPYGEGGLHFCAPHPPKVPQVPRGEGEGTQTFVPSRPPPPPKVLDGRTVWEGGDGGIRLCLPPSQGSEDPNFVPHSPQRSWVRHTVLGGGVPTFATPLTHPQGPKVPNIVPPPPFQRSLEGSHKVTGGAPTFVPPHEGPGRVTQCRGEGSQFCAPLLTDPGGAAQFWGGVGGTDGRTPRK